MPPQKKVQKWNEQAIVDTSKTAFALRNKLVSSETVDMNTVEREALQSGIMGLAISNNTRLVDMKQHSFHGMLQAAEVEYSSLYPAVRNAAPDQKWAKIFDADLHFSDFISVFLSSISGITQPPQSLGAVVTSIKQKVSSGQGHHEHKMSASDLGMLNEAFKTLKAKQGTVAFTGVAVSQSEPIINTQGSTTKSQAKRAAVVKSTTATPSAAEFSAFSAKHFITLLGPAGKQPLVSSASSVEPEGPNIAAAEDSGVDNNGYTTLTAEEIRMLCAIARYKLYPYAMYAPSANGDSIAKKNAAAAVLVEAWTPLGTLSQLLRPHGTDAAAPAGTETAVTVGGHDDAVMVENKGEQALAACE